jgi:hypothetical protein
MMRKLISLREKLKNTSSYHNICSNACDSLLKDNYKIIRTIACLNSDIELLKPNVSCDSCEGMLAENEKLKLNYSICVEQHEIARAEIIEINSMHSITCSSTLNNDTCIDSNDNHDVLLGINACNVSTISYTSCNDLKHEIDDLKQVRDDMSANDVGCGPIFSMNMTMGVKITCETLTNSPAVPLLPMQQISTLWIFATPHTCARSRRARSSLQSTNSQWNDRLHLIFRIEITRSQQSGERKIL